MVELTVYLREISLNLDFWRFFSEVCYSYISYLKGISLTFC